MCFTNVLQRHGFHDVTELQIKRTIGKTLEESFAILTGINDPAQLSALKQEYTKGEILDVILKEYGIKKTQGYSEIKAAQKLAKDLYYAD